MSQLVLATADLAFEEKVRDAFDGELEGQLRYWRDGLAEDPSRMVTDLTGMATTVVAIGPDFSPESALELTRALDTDRPEISVVIVAQPSAKLLQSALRAGARDVIAPDAPKGALRAAIERAMETAVNRRSAMDREEVAAPDQARVIAVVCPKGGAGQDDDLVEPCDRSRRGRPR